MIKYSCDRCGKSCETDEINYIKFLDNEGDKQCFQLCAECYAECYNDFVAFLAQDPNIKGKLAPRGTPYEVFIYDEEEIHENCTVQILKNSVTVEISIGWWENEN